jgi:hypothetical protein
MVELGQTPVDQPQLSLLVVNQDAAEGNEKAGQQI